MEREELAGGSINDVPIAVGAFFRAPLQVLLHSGFVWPHAQSILDFTIARVNNRLSEIGTADFPKVSPEADKFRYEWFRGLCLTRKPNRVACNAHLAEVALQRQELCDLLRRRFATTSNCRVTLICHRIHVPGSAVG